MPQNNFKYFVLVTENNNITVKILLLFSKNQIYYDIRYINNTLKCCQVTFTMERPP